MRGSTLLCDTDYPVLGASFFSVSGVEYPVWLDNLGNLTYRTGGVNTLIEAGLATDKEVEFVAYNDAQPVLFGCNETDGLFKVDQTFSYFNIDSNPTSCICYSGTSKRIFRSFGNVVKYSDQ
jgi:hypothetical protein